MTDFLIAAKLLETVDPGTGMHPIRRMFRDADIYSSRTYQDVAPDLVIGYDKGTRVSDDSALGGVSREVLEDNTRAWSGDHCMDPDVVRGILLTSRPLTKPAASLQTLAGAVLAEFGVDRFPPVPQEP